MNQFIKPPFEKLKWGRYENHRNIPVNLINVNGIKKKQLKYYPDNDGVPSIYFLGTETKNLEDGIIWIFNKEKERDDCFEAIANNSFNVVNQLDPDRIRASQLLHPQDIYFKDNL